MTVAEFQIERKNRPCRECGQNSVETELNPNNNGLLVHCQHCGSKTPWGKLLFLKQKEKRSARAPLPRGETLDSIWEKFGNHCVMCGAPKDALMKLGIGRQVHHVVPYTQAGHQGPLVPICTHCHPMVTDRQRIYWFYQRVVLKIGATSVSTAPDDVPVASSR